MKKAKRQRTRCFNCKFRGEFFRINGLNHLHCENEEAVTPFAADGQLSAWDSLRVFWDTCDKHEPRA